MEQPYLMTDVLVMASAQVHLRHLVGGRARSFMGELPHERIFQVDFPERPGALRRFLTVFSPTFLITLFHYRKTGPCPRIQMQSLPLHLRFFFSFWAYRVILECVSVRRLRRAEDWS